MTSLSSLQPIELKLSECERRKSSIAFNKNGYTNNTEIIVVVEYHKMKKVIGVRTKDFSFGSHFRYVHLCPNSLKVKFKMHTGWGRTLSLLGFLLEDGWMKNE